MKDSKKKAETIGYTAASQELEQILQQIESGEVDLDVLSDQVERAAQLIAICKAKLAATELKVNEAVANLAAGDDTADADDDEDAEV